jgi:hypothetical protein
LNIDDATLYRFYYQRTVACDEPFGCELWVERLPSARSGLDPLERSRVEIRGADSLLALVANHLGLGGFLCLIFKLKEYIIRRWTFNVRCWTFISFFLDQTGRFSG